MFENKYWRKPKGKSRMDNPETLVGAKDTERRQAIQKNNTENLKEEQHGPGGEPAKQARKRKINAYNSHMLVVKYLQFKHDLNFIHLNIIIKF